MANRPKLTPFVVFLLWCGSALGADKPWLEVRSPHFRVITNGSEGDGRHVAGQFEFMRSVFSSQFPGFRFDPPEPLLILAPLDQDTARALVPQMWNGRYLTMAGMFVSGWEKQYALVRLDSVISDRNDPDPYSTLYHEYTHQFLHMNLRWLPVWLDEGLAEFYGYTRFEKDKMYIGAPPRSLTGVDVLNSRVSVPLSTFIARQNSISRDETDTQLFYAQAWALTHFLTFGPGMEGGNRLKRFFNELQRGVEQQKAFVDAFGNIQTVDEEYQKYIQRFAFTTGVLPAPANIQEKAFTTRRLSAAETQAELAGFEMRLPNWDQVRLRAEAALKNDPKLALAHEDMAFSEFNEGKDEDAVREFSQALDLDNKMYMSLFAKLMMSPLATSDVPADREALKQGLQKIIEINPEFAAAYVELAKVSVAQGDLHEAFSYSRKAEQLAPFRAGYHILSGEILRRMGRDRDAATFAVFVAERWGVPDHDEAMELWNRIPKASRGDEVPQKPSYAEDWKVAEGVVKSVACHEHDFTVTLDDGGQLRTFHGKSVGTGFSDTLWVGDHFNRCFHVDGLRGVVHYKSPDKSTADGLINVSFRDDLPTAHEPAAAAQAQSKIP
jgi:Tfp pilus assembly protein PilF